MSKEKFCSDRSMGYLPKDQVLSNAKINAIASASDVVACEVATQLISIAAGAEDGYVLTSDAAGNASWQPVPTQVCTGVGELTVGTGLDTTTCLSPGAAGSFLSIVAGVPTWAPNPNTPYDPVAAGEISWTPNPNIDSLQGTGTQFVRVGNTIYMTGAWTANVGLAANTGFLDAGTINFLTVSPYPTGAGPNTFNSYNNVAYFTAGATSGQLALFFQPGIPLRLYNTANLALIGGAPGDAIAVFLSFVVA